MAECSESTGTIWPVPRGGLHQGTADYQGFLVGQCQGGA